MNISDQIRAFTFYVKHRQLCLALELGKHFENANDTTPFKQSGYVILSITTAYFEMIQQFLEGRSSDRNSKAFFIKGFQNVYPHSALGQQQIEKIYRIVRCGMYHGGMTKFGCHLSREFRDGIHLCYDEIHINPAALSRELINHFDCYIASLTADAHLQHNFETMCAEMGLFRSNANFTRCVSYGTTTIVPTTPEPTASGEPAGPLVTTEQ